MKRLSVIFVSLILLISISSCSNSKHYSKYERNNYSQNNSLNDYHKKFDVNRGGSLDLNIETGGSLKVIGWNKNVVDVKIELKGRDKDDVEDKEDEDDHDGDDKTMKRISDNNNSKTTGKLEHRRIFCCQGPY